MCDGQRSHGCCQMIHAIAEDGLAAVTEDEHDCCDCYSRGAKWLTREEALEAAQELIELAPGLMTTDECDAAGAIEAFCLWIEWVEPPLLTIATFAGPFDASVPWVVKKPEVRP